MMSNTIDRKYIKMNVEGIDIYTFPFKIKDLITISYVAVRGRDCEAGAVQRVLNKKRIDSIKQYVLDGNLFINTFILNWTDENTKPVFESKRNRTALAMANAVLLFRDYFYSIFLFLISIFYFIYF